MTRRLRWEAKSVPREGMVLDNFPGSGFSYVEAIEDDPETAYELSNYGNEIPEYRPKTLIVVLRPATDAEVAKEQAWYSAEPPKAPSMLERIFR